MQQRKEIGSGPLVKGPNSPNGAQLNLTTDKTGKTVLCCCCGNVERGTIFLANYKEGLSVNLSCDVKCTEDRHVL